MYIFLPRYFISRKKRLDFDEANSAQTENQNCYWNQYSLWFKSDFCRLMEVLIYAKALADLNVFIIYYTICVDDVVF